MPSLYYNLQIYPRVDTNAHINTHTPASTSFPLFGIGQANPLSHHGADVIAGVKVGLLNFASIYHINNIIDGDAVRSRRERKGGKHKLHVIIQKKKKPLQS